MIQTYDLLTSDSGDAPVTTTAAEYLQILAGVNVAGEGGASGVQLSGATADGEVDVAGTVGGAEGIYYGFATGDETLSVAPTGSVIAGGDGVYLAVSSAGAGGPQIVRNAGYIYGGVRGVYAFNNSSQPVQIENSGTIEGGTAIVVASSADENIVNDGSGLITGAQAISVSGDDALLDNDGKISGTSSTEAAVKFSGSYEDVDTSGDIKGVSTAIDFTGSGAFTSVYNSGTISAVRYAVNFEGGSDNYLENSGTIIGEVNFGGAENWVVNQLGSVMEVQPNFNVNVISSSGADSHVVNRGEMTGNVNANGDDSSFTNTGDYAGEMQIYGGDAIVRNAGKITFDESATQQGGQNIYIEGATGEDDRMVNAAGGVIDATGGIAISHDGLGTFRLINRGDTYGEIELYSQSSVVNAGEIGGDVFCEAAATVFVNRGAVDGDVAFTGAGNIYRGYLGEVTGTIYGAGADGRYFGGEGDDTFDMTASGAKLVVGGDGDDTFIFTAAGLTANTVIRGGAGDDTLTFSTAGAIAASAFLNVRTIETINLAASGTNTLTVPDALVSSANGGSLTINGGSGVDNVNLSAVVNPNDTVTVYGGGGADNITAGGGAEVFAYSRVTDSTGTGTDNLKSVNFALDRVSISSFASPVLAINAPVTTGNLSGATFNSDLTTDLNGKLGAHDAVLFTASGGALTGQTYLVVDVNGTAGYQANADLVIHLTGQTGSLTTANFS